MKRFVNIVGLLLLTGMAASAQEYYTVLSNNADLTNTYLYVELMYTKPQCRDAQATFVLALSNPTDTSVIAVDSFLNNIDTYETEASKPYYSIKRPKASGYRLRFRLPNDAADRDPRICVKSSMQAMRCEGCGAGGSNTIFNDGSKAAGCPYTDTQGDLRACYKRNNPVDGQWEAWIQDSRDCNAYRIVYMPDSKWWFAQNLNFQLDLEVHSTAGVGDIYDGFWCPGGASMTAPTRKTPNNGATEDNKTVDAGGNVACNTYGALYNWTTATTNAGRGTPNLPQGICPAGWRLPEQSDFLSLFNHGAIGLDYANRKLKANLSCRPHTSETDTACATTSTAAWSWRRHDYTGKVANPLAISDNRFGFSLLPAGKNNGTNFVGLGYAAYLWTSTDDALGAVCVKISDIQAAAPPAIPQPQLLPEPVASGLSVRCVKP